MNILRTSKQIFRCGREQTGMIQWEILYQLWIFFIFRLIRRVSRVLGKLLDNKNR